MASEERFGFEWDKYWKMDPNYERQFLGWLGPFGKDFIRGKTVLDAGCGMGRNAYWCIKYGAKSILAFDNNGRTVNAAKKNLQYFPNA